MQKLLLLRHFRYDGNNDDGGGRINAAGRMDLESLFPKLKEIVGDQSILILSSTAGRATSAAEIIAQGFGTTFETDEVLWSDSDHRQDNFAFGQLIEGRQHEADVLLLITHLEYVERFPFLYTQEKFGKSLGSRNVGKGQLCVIDLEAQTFQLVSP